MGLAQVGQANRETAGYHSHHISLPVAVSIGKNKKVF